MSSNPADLRRGATTLLVECLGVKASDAVVVIGNPETLALAEAIVATAKELCPATLAIVDAVTTDNHADIQDALAAVLDAGHATVSVFAGADDADLLAWNQSLGEMVRERGIRHAHMPGVDDHCLAVGLAGPYRDVALFNEEMGSILEPVQEIAITNDDGTDIVFQCEPRQRKWTALTGIYDRPGVFGRLPQGEIFCAPLEAEGTIAARVIGYPFNTRWGLLEEPVLVEVTDGNAVNLRHADEALQTTLWTWLASHENGTRVGELALGTNRKLPAITGNLLFDENVPGVHIAFGHPFPEHTGADYRSPIHVDLVLKEPDVTIDDVRLMNAGTYNLSDGASRAVSG